MKRDMSQWLKETIRQKQKKAIPVLSFPAIQLMHITVRDLVTNSGLQAKAMQTIAERTATGAALSLMDLSVEAECFGSQVRYFDDEVPTIVGRVVEHLADAEQLSAPRVGAGRTGIYLEAIEKALALIGDRPVLAGVIGPFSLAGRLMDVSASMTNCYEKPEMVHLVLSKAVAFLTAYCKAYKEAGANGVVLAEPLAGLLSPSLAAEFSAPYVKKIIDQVQDDGFVVVYHNCGDYVKQMLDSILATGAAAYHFGNKIDLGEILPRMPGDKVIMGNVDPAGEFKNGTPESIKKQTLEIMAKCSAYPNFVISSGCDIPAMSPWENIDAFFAAVNGFYERKNC